MIKTLGFTYLNPHVYSDTVFFLGNFSKNFLYIDKIYFGLGATLASFLFFFILGYLSKFLSQYLKSQLTWKFINFFIIIFMSSLSIYVIREILAYWSNATTAAAMDAILAGASSDRLVITIGTLPPTTTPAAHAPIK